jgi:hypothetical protein
MSLSGMYMQRPAGEPETAYLNRVLTALEDQNL